MDRGSAIHFFSYGSDRFNGSRITILPNTGSIGLDLKIFFLKLSRYVSYTLTISFVGLTLFSWSFYSSDLTEKCKTMFALIPGIQCCIRLALFITKHSKLQHKLLTETQKVLMENEKASKDREFIVKRGAKIAQIASIALLGGYFAFILGFTLLCLIHHFIYGTNYLTYYTKYPFDIESEAAYLLVSLYLAFLSHCGYSMLATFDSTLVVFVTQMVTNADLFVLRLREIGSEIANLDKKNIKYAPKVKKLMKEIVDEHRKYNNYLKLFLDYANASIFLIISLSVISNAACMITIMTSDFFAAYGFLALCIVQLFVACIIGTTIAHQNDKIYDCLWNFEWFNLPVSDQKTFLVILHYFQQPINMKIPFIGFVNMELFKAV
jgi:hypothetical protein